jgi:hypothetical protein
MSIRAVPGGCNDRRHGIPAKITQARFLADRLRLSGLADAGVAAEAGWGSNLPLNRLLCRLAARLRPETAPWARIGGTPVCSRTQWCQNLYCGDVYWSTLNSLDLVAASLRIANNPLKRRPVRRERNYLTCVDSGARVI